MALTLAEIKKRMIAKIADSALTPSDVNKLKFKAMTAEEVKAAGYSAQAAGFLIPYFDTNGKVNCFARLRYLEETRKGFDKLGSKKAMRYAQLPGTVNRAYFAPFVDWDHTLKGDDTLVITEGELKAACATKLGVPTIGLGGVGCFKSNRKNKTLIDDLAKIDWPDKHVVICYDSDAVSNPQVMMMENLLAKTLADLGARVCIARLPSGTADKVGIDDFLTDPKNTVEDFEALINNAEPYAGSEALHAMSENVVYIRNPGLIYDYQHDMRISTTQFTQHAFANYWHDETTPAGKTLKVQTAQKWVNWPGRSELEAVVFEPGKSKVTSGKLNIWDGWAYMPEKGDATPWLELLDHLFTGCPDKQARKWFEQWVAYPVQNPGVKMMSAALFWGTETGTGKTMVGHTLMKLYGKYATEIKDAQLRTDDYAWAENKQFALLDEITGSDSRFHKNKLKTLISQKELHINIKYLPKYVTEDRINYYITSQDGDAVNLDDEDRRYFIHEVRCGKVNDKFIDDYVAWRDSTEGMAALMYYLLHLNTDSFNPFAPAYSTLDKRSMIKLSKGDLAHWVADLKEDTRKKLANLEGDLFTSEELLQMYDPFQSGKVTKNGMSRELMRAGFRPVNHGVRVQTKFGNVVLWAIKNRSFWVVQEMRDIIAHYETHRLMLPLKGRVKKF